jgi:Helix-turn-helix domain
MRLVLDGHMRRMDHDGKGCWAGVRDLAKITGLNKDTIAEHRALALSAGWLIPAPAAEARHPDELWAAVPDGIEIDPQSERTWRPRSRGARHSIDTVRRDRTNCPVPPDVPLQTSIPLHRESEASRRKSSADNSAEMPTKSRELRLLAWLA